MSIKGKIKTLFSDKDKAEALFPRTKTSAVSDDNNIDLNTLLDNINTTVNNKAPAGYGLGVQSELTVISTLTQVDTTKANGWYQVNLIAANQSIGGMALGSMRVDAGAHIVHQTFYGYAANSTSETRVLVRTWSDDTQAWGEWEWENPPMWVGVEYRTTERRVGKPVYTKLIEVGQLPNNSTKTVSTGIDASRMFRSNMSAYNHIANAHTPVLYHNFAEQIANYILVGTNVTVTTNHTDFVGYSGSVQIWYI